ncbi:MAG TPA: porin family protein [Flavobacteriaceae bacterium]|nr:porin family protein [Flavobacteriaceae bacterium]
MKTRYKILILSLCALLLNGSVFSQVSKREKGALFGVKGGLNVASFISSDIQEKMAVRTSPHIGVLSEMILGGDTSLQIELLYSGQGYIGEDTKKKFDYITLPVLIKYYVMPDLSIDAGPQAGFLVSAIERGNDGNDKIQKQSVFDFGVNLGLGYDIANGIFCQARYNLGLTNVNRSVDADVHRYANSVFQISVGYMF